MHPRNRNTTSLALIIAIAAGWHDAGGQARDSLAAGVLPAPTGSFALGIAQLELIDSSRFEWSPDRVREPRVIPLTVVYPASRSDGDPAPYLAEASVLADHQLLGPNSRRLVETIARQARRNAPPAMRPGGFPVVLFSPGRGERAAWYTALHEELASHGIIVVTLAHAGMADVVLGNGTLVRHYPAIWDPKPAGWDAHLDSTMSVTLRRAVYDSFYVAAADYLHEDVVRVLEHLVGNDGLLLGTAGRIAVNPAAVIAGGHSYGANVAVEACHRDERLSGCFSLDGGAFAAVRDVGMRRPYLVVRPAFENDGYPRGVAQDQLFGSMRTWAWEVNLVGANHRSFMDAPFWVARSTAERSADRFTAITAEVIRAFVNTVATAPRDVTGRLDAVVARHPDVIARTITVRGGVLVR